MKKLLFVPMLLVWSIGISAPKTIDVKSDADEVVKLWDNSKAKYSNEEEKDEEINERGHLAHTSEAVMFIYKADSKNATGQGVVVLPGGGYSKVCIEHEGFAMARWFKENGITAIVLKYRLPNLGHKEVPLEDAVGALRYMRKNAKKLGVDASKVGICGGSAGGHLAAYTSTFAEIQDRPAFAILFYPVITGTTWFTHHNTFRFLLGAARTPKMQEKYSLENAVDENTPPTILLLSDDDKTVPPISSVLYYKALKNYGIKATMHIYPSGGHGWAGHEEFKYKEEVKAALKDWLSILQ